MIGKPQNETGMTSQPQSEPTDSASGASQPDALPVGLSPNPPPGVKREATMWIDGNGTEQRNDVGFLVERFDQNHAVSHYQLQRGPAHTNLSGEPRLSGWCGDTDNIGVHAHGMARVLRVARSTERLLVRKLSGTELSTALQECGYPGLR